MSKIYKDLKINKFFKNLITQFKNSIKTNINFLQKKIKMANLYKKCSILIYSMGKIQITSIMSYHLQTYQYSY